MWHLRAIWIAMAGVCLLVVPFVRADSLQLKNGNFVQGKYLGGTERSVQFQANGRIRLYDIDEILSISFSSASADGGIPSNYQDPKPSTNTRLHFSAKDGLREASKGRHTIPIQLITEKQKQCGGTANEPAAGMPYFPPRRVLVEKVSKPKAVSSGSSKESGPIVPSDRVVPIHKRPFDSGALL